MVKGQSEKLRDLLLEKEKAINKSVTRGNQPDDLKSAAGEIYNSIKRILSLTGCGSDAESFCRGTLASLVTPDTQIYKVLYADIFAPVVG